MLSVHLAPAVSDSGSFIVGHFTAPSEHVREMRAHLAALAVDPMPTLIVGDFNEESGGALAYLEEQGLSDALRQHAPGVPTWSWPVGSFRIRLALDHVLHDAHFECVHLEVRDSGRSDHLPVVAHLRAAP